MHVGSNGNLWSDLERMPAERRLANDLIISYDTDSVARHLVLTPTVMKRQEEHISEIDARSFLVLRMECRACAAAHGAGAGQSN